MEAEGWGKGFDSWGTTVNAEDQETSLPKQYLKCQSQTQQPVFFICSGFRHEMKSSFANYLYYSSYSLP